MYRATSQYFQYQLTEQKTDKSSPQHVTGSVVDTAMADSQFRDNFITIFTALETTRFPDKAGSEGSEGSHCLQQISSVALRSCIMRKLT
jgi:hypothetical protein